MAEHVIMGRKDVGGIKESVARKYEKYLRVISKTPSIRDHAVVVSQTLSEEKQQRIKKALLELKQPNVLRSVKPSLTGFLEANNDVYDDLVGVMHQVDEVYQSAKNH